MKKTYFQDGGEVTLTPDQMTLMKRRVRELGGLPDVVAPTRKGGSGSGLPAGAAGAAAAKAYKKYRERKRDEERAPEFFREQGQPDEFGDTYQLETAVPYEEGQTKFEFDTGLTPSETMSGDLGDEFRALAEGSADGGLIGSLAGIIDVIGKQQESPFPEATQMGEPDNKPSAKIKEPQAFESGGLVVTRTNERKGKTHKVVDKKTGETQYFGDPDLKNKANSPARKAAFYSRHKKNLEGNRFFRAYARATWADGGLVDLSPMPEIDATEESLVPQTKQKEGKDTLGQIASVVGTIAKIAPLFLQDGGGPIEVPESFLSEEEKKRRQKQVDLNLPAPAFPAGTEMGRLVQDVARENEAIRAAAAAERDLGKKAVGVEEALATPPKPPPPTGELPLPSLPSVSLPTLRGGGAREGESAISPSILVGGERGIPEVKFESAAQAKKTPTREEFMAQKAAERAAAEAEPKAEAAAPEAPKEAAKKVITIAPKKAPIIVEVLTGKLKKFEKEINDARNLPEDKFDKTRIDIMERADKELHPKEKVGVAKALQAVMDDRRKLDRFVRGQSERALQGDARSPLRGISGEATNVERYGKKGAAQFDAFYSRALAEQGGVSSPEAIDRAMDEIMGTTGKSPEERAAARANPTARAVAQRNKIIQNDRERQDVARRIAAEMMATYYPNAKQDEEAEAVATEREISAAETADAATKDAARDEQGNVVAAEEAPAEPVAAPPEPAPMVMPPAAAPATGPAPAGTPAKGLPQPSPAPTPATSIEAQLQGQIDAREVEMARLAKAQKEGAEAGRAVGIMGAIQALQKIDPTTKKPLVDASGQPVRFDTRNPVDRYSPEVEAIVSQTGDYALVKTALEKVGYSPENAKRVAIDEVLRGSQAGVEKMPTGIEAMEMARQSPEYQQAARAAATRAQIEMEQARLKVKEAQILTGIRQTQIDLDLKLAQDYDLKKRTLDAQTAAVRKGIMDASIQPTDYFQENPKMSVLLGALQFLGTSMGGQGAFNAVGQAIQGKINRELQLQVANLDRKKGVLSDLVAQGNSLDDSYKLADAFYKKLFAGQIEKAMAGVSDQKVRLAGLAEAQKLLEAAGKEEADILKKQTDTIRDFYKNKLDGAATGVKSAAEYARIAASMKPTTKGRGTSMEDKKAFELWKRSLGEAPEQVKPFLEGKPVDPAIWTKAWTWKPELRKSSVKLTQVQDDTFTKGDGSKVPYQKFAIVPNRFMLAVNDTEAKGLETLQQNAFNFLSALDDLEKITAKYDYQGSKLAKLTGEELGKVQTIIGNLGAKLGGPAGYNVGVPQEAEYQRILAALPTMEMFTRGSLTAGKFDQFRKDMIGVVRRAQEAALVGGSAVGSGPAMPAPKSKGVISVP